MRGLQRDEDRQPARRGELEANDDSPAGHRFRGGSVGARGRCVADRLRRLRARAGRGDLAVPLRAQRGGMADRRRRRGDAAHTRRRAHPARRRRRLLPCRAPRVLTPCATQARRPRASRCRRSSAPYGDACVYPDSGKVKVSGPGFQHRGRSASRSTTGRASRERRQPLRRRGEEGRRRSRRLPHVVCARRAADRRRAARLVGVRAAAGPEHLSRTTTRTPRRSG